MSLSKRWELVLFLFTAAIVSYMNRVNISVCAQKMRDEFGWSDYQKGLILSAFFWGYTVGQIPAAIASDKVGGKFTLGFAVVGSSLLTLLVPLASHSSFALALATRGLIGLAQAATFPSCFYFYPRWVPVTEKTIMITFNLAGMYLGEILGFGLSGALIAVDIDIGSTTVKGWELVFYLFGLIGLLWFPLFYWRVYDNPTAHPYCSEEERSIIKTGWIFVTCINHEEGTDETPLLADDARSRLRSRASSTSSSRSLSESIISGTVAPTTQGFIGRDKDIFITLSDKKLAEEDESDIEAKVVNRDFSSVPWKAIFTNQASITLLLGFWTFGWIGYMVLTEMPSYLNDELGYDLSQAGLLSVLPYCCNFASVMCCGRFFDFLEREKNWSTRDVRQWASRISFIGASASLIISGFMDSPLVAFVFMNVALGFFGFIVSGLNCAFLEVSPNFSNTINTVANMVGAIAGFVGPLTVSLFLALFEDSRDAWRMVFFVTGGFSVLSLIHWNFYQTCEVVPALNTPVKKA